MWSELSLSRLGTAFLLSAAISVLAWRAKALSQSGAIAAFFVGGVVFGVGGWSGAAVLLTFFLSSSLLSRAFARHKEELGQFVLKGTERDAAQVLANGGFSTLCVLLGLQFPMFSGWFLAFCGGLAAANADTWATELGALSPQPPRLLSTGQIVPRGTSGGVTPLGLLASLLGAALVGAVAAWFASERLLTFGAVSVGGVVGSLFDSWLGAGWQAVYRCSRCEKETEQHPRHACGEQTYRVRGWKWLDNDGVNFACTVLGGIVAAGLGLLR
ncbi:MAG: DUF92 domain-containing protein [Anaerolineales bacterium]|nr:DUF92 domain-containing protein [Anaerolineales bacterium]MCS7247832.1 DUF92 domain-containing protein [Anaerolineales bacterium]MDW8161642.1 DUF92 domain-containing protein [Anaerolineales bacterium]MDW8447863.1 DUF92 domain-containing protein [Anaerolineales bacterium]